MNQSILKVTGMTCSKCVQHVKRALLSIPGVRTAEVDLAEGLARIEHEGADMAAMITAIEEEGYEATESA